MDLHSILKLFGEFNNTLSREVMTNRRMGLKCPESSGGPIHWMTIDQFTEIRY